MTAGTYSVIVTDANGCTGETSVTVTESASLMPTISGDTEICPGGSTTLDAGNYTSYQWGGESNATTQTVDAITAGTYSVTVTDASGCTGETMVTVTEFTPPNPMISGATSFCTGSSTTLDAGNYASYQWSGGSTATTQTVDASTAGDYTVVVTDDNGCTGTATVTITEAAGLMPTISGEDNFCQGGSTTLDAGSYTSYQWSGGSTATTQTITVNMAGDYTVVVTDDNGCTGTATVAVTEEASLNPTITGDDNFCPSGSTMLDAGSGFASYQWGGGSTETTQTITATAAGDYFVTVTDAGGCTGEAMITISENTAPMPSISGATSFCSGSSTTLDAGVYVSYQWSGGSTATTQTIDASTAGDYTVVVTDDNGCTGTATVTITESSALMPTISGDDNFCPGSSTTLDAGAYASYQWSGGSTATTQTIDASTAGDYIVVVTDASGCTGEATITITENTPPTVTIGGSTSFCPGGSTTLDAGAYAGYQWSGGSTATTQTITATTAGDYTVVVTDGNGCTGTATVTVTEQASLMPTITGDDNFCPGGSTMLDAGSGFTSYQWGGGSTATTQTIDATAAGTYSVTVMDASGCSGEAMITITENTEPTPMISGATSFCSGGSTMLDAGTYASYQWSGGSTATTQTITADMPGDYTVVVTDDNGCTGTAMVTVTEAAELMPTISGDDNFCPGGSTMLDAGTYASYQWSGGSTATTQTIDASVAGDYTVVVTDASGCTGEATITITENTPPTVTIGGSTSYCPGSSTTLDAGVYASYQWSGGSTATTQTITVNTAGDYTVVVTDDNGCTVTATVTVTEEASLNPNITGDDSFCTGGSTTLDAGSGFASYQWGGGSTATTQTIDASAAGTYSVTVMDAGGCSGEATITITENPLPTPTISGGTSICPGGSTMLDAGTYASYQWSGGSTATTQTIDATAAGDYTVVVTDDNGCTGTATVTVTENSALSVTISGDDNFCPGGSTTLDAGTYASYQWSGGSTATTQTIDASAAGDYTVVVTDASGCTGEATITITENTPPTVTIGGSTSFCPGGSTTLDAGAGYTAYQWSGGSTATTQTITATTAGDYTVVVTDGNGCTGTATVTVTEQASLNPTITGEDNFCPGGSTMLDAGSGFSSYQWGGGSTATTQTITATAAGTYSVTVTDASGCSGETMITISENPEPMPSISGNTSFCTGNSTTLDAGAFASYQWGGQSNATTQTIDASTAGDYFVTVTDGNGCTGTAMVTVTEDAPFSVTITGEDSFCNDGMDTADLDAGSGFVAYDWSTGDDTQTISVSMGGVYTVTVTDGSGCTGEGSFTVTENTPPTASISGSTTYCTGGSTTLTASGGVSYLWSTGETTDMIMVDMPGQVSVTVTDANGCSASNTVDIIENSSLNPSISGANALCTGNTETLDAGNGFTSYDWSTGATTSSIDITMGGIYEVTVSDANGCTGSASINVSENPPPSPSITGDNSFCQGGGSPAVLDAGGGFASYIWSGGETTQTISTTSAGDYSVTVTDASGCTGEDSFSVTESPSPMPTITGDDTICQGGTTVLDAGSFASYSWSTGAITQSVSNIGVGSYSVTVTDGNGCTGSNSFTVSEQPPIAVSITGDDNFCTGAGNMADLDAGAGFVSYDWSNGATTQNISVANGGNYTVIVTDANGCTGSDTYNVTANNPPSGNITGSQTFCSGSNTTLSAPAGFTYDWSNGATTQTITVDQANTYSVVITDGNGCSNTASINVSESASLNPSISGNNTFCTGNATTLDAGSFATYMWSNGMTTQTISPTTAGNYAVTVSDASGCTGVDNISVTEAPTPNPNIAGNDAFCEGDATNLTASGAGPGGSYQWSNGASTASISANNAGTFTVIATNSAGCTAETSITVSENPAPTTFVVGDMEICPNEPTTLNAGAGFNSYSWSNGTTGQSNVVLNPGPVSVTVTDANGCEGVATANVTQAQAPVVNIAGDNAVCDGEPATLNAGNAGNTYQWSTGATSQTIDVTNSGTYSVIVTNSAGCSAEDEHTVNVAPNPVAVIGGSTSFCTGGSTTLDAGSGFSYQWSNGSTSQTIVVNNPGDFTVVITNAAGCSDEAAVSVAESAALQPNITGGNVFCEGQSTTLNAGSGFATYEWSNGSTSQQIPVDNSGNFSVTVTDGTGCSGSANLIVTETPNPVANIAGDLDFCPGQNTQLNAGNGFANYVWSTGNLNQMVTVANPGTVSVTVTDDNGCSDVASVEITENEAPTTFIEGDIQFCENENTVLNAGDGFAAYQWSNNTTNQTLTADASGTYIVTVTDENGCTGTANVAVTEFINPVPTINGDDSFCEGDAANLSVGNGFTNYTWSNGGTTPSITVQNGGTFDIIVEDANGCLGTAEFTVAENDNPVVEIGGSTTFCTGSQTTLNAGSGFANYTWSSGATSPSIIVNDEGSFDVTVTDNNGCVGTASTSVTESAELEPVITGPTSFCEGGETTLNAGSGFGTYNWSNGETTQIITVLEPGDLTVTVTDQTGGCSGETAVSIIENANPVAAISGDTDICPDETTVLDAGTGFEYEWSTGTLNQTINVSNGGNFEVTITDDNGCSSVASAEVMEFEAPTPAITGDDAICPDEVSVLDAGAGFAEYMWSNGSVNPTLQVMNGGTFSVVVEDENGCVGEADFTVVQNEAPTVSILGDNSFCDGETVTLDAGNNFDTYEWSDGSTTSTLEVMNSGTFSVVVTNVAGCEGMAEFTAVENELPEVSIGGSSTFCAGSNTTLDVGSGFANVSWSNGATTPAITVNTTDDFSVVVTDANGCEASSMISVAESTELTVNIIGNPDFCEGGSTILDAGSGFANYMWSNGETTQSIILDTPNNYTVTVDDGAGCLGEATVEVIENANPVPVISGDLEFCTGSSTTLEAEAGFISYLWSNNSINPTLDVTNPGNVILTVEDENGCVGSNDVEVIEADEIAIEITGPTSFCTGSTATLDAGPGQTYQWSTGETTQTIEVAANGTYEVVVTNAEGCTGTDDETVIEADELEIEILGPTVICDNGTITLDGGAGFDSYMWSNGETTQTIEVTNPGDIELVVADAAGCEGSDMLTIAEAPPISVTITGDDTICDGEMTVLDAGSGFDTYMWSTGETTQTITVSTQADFEVMVSNVEGCTGMDMISVAQAPPLTVSILGNLTVCDGTTTTLDAGSGFDSYMWSTGETTQTITVPNGDYEVMVTSAEGCTGSDLATVEEAEELEVAILGAADFCDGETVTLDAGSGFDSYMWSNGETTQTITVDATGTYDVAVADASGCMGTAAVSVQEYEPETVSISGSATFCTGNFTTLDAGPNFDSYMWSTGETTQTIQVSNPGDVTVQVINANGCMAENSLAISESTELEPQIAGDLDFCEGQNTVLDAGSGFDTYMWSNGETTQTITTDIPGDYTVLVSDASGCTGEGAVSVLENALPTVEIATANTNFCEDASATLDAGSGFANYQWSNSGLNQTTEITDGGTFSVVVTDANGCTNSDDIEMNEVALPTADAGNDDELDCVITSTELTGAGNGNNLTYQWTTNDGSFAGDPNQQTVMIDGGGTYILTIIEDLAGCVGTDEVVVEENIELPEVEAGANIELDCFENEAELDGTGSAQGLDFQYKWTAQNGSPIQNATTLTPTITEPDVYTLTVTNLLSQCSDSDMLEVLMDDAAAQGVDLALESPTCAGDTDGSVAVQDVIGGEGPFTYSFNGQPFTNDVFFTQLPAGEYDLVIQSANGCTYEETLAVPDGNTLTVEAGEDQIIKLGQTIDLNPEIDINAGQLDIIQWSIADSTGCENCANITIAPTASTVYTITVIDENGCEVTDFLNVTVDSRIDVHFPSAFSPNRDGRNETFMIYAEEGFVQNINTFQVFNRWGVQVFENSDFMPNDMTGGWDGTFKGDNAEMGVYIYFAEVELINGEKVMFKGDVTLLR